MAYLNKVLLMGNVGSDPDVRTFGDKKVASFTFATTEKKRDKAGEVKEQTEWHRVSVWGQQAELVERYVKKGASLYIEGKITYREYEKDGQKRSITEILASQLQFIGARPADKPASQPAAPQYTPPAPPAAQPAPQNYALNPNDLPF